MIDRVGQTWMLLDMIILVVRTNPGEGTDAHHTWHQCFIIDSPRNPHVAGKLMLFVEKPDKPWEDDQDEPSWERVA